MQPRGAGARGSQHRLVALRAQGYGEYCPLDAGHNEEAWEKNRRVEFKVVKTKDGPTGVERGCARALERGVSPPTVKE